MTLTLSLAVAGESVLCVRPRRPQCIDNVTGMGVDGPNDATLHESTSTARVRKNSRVTPRTSLRPVRKI